MIVHLIPLLFMATLISIPFLSIYFIVKLYLDHREKMSNIAKEDEKLKFDNNSVQWIDTKQKLPKVSNFDEKHLVLVYDKFGHMFTAKFMQFSKDEEPQWCQFKRDEYNNADILFWTELPSLPTGVSK